MLCPPEAYGAKSFARVHAAKITQRRIADFCIRCLTSSDRLRPLLSACVKDELEEDLRDGNERVWIAVGGVDLRAAQTQMVGNRDVRAGSLAVAAAIGLRRKADHAPHADRERRVRAHLIRVRDLFEPLDVGWPGMEILRRIV